MRLVHLYLAALLIFDLQDDGLKALDQKNYQQAEEIFGKLAAADPKDYSALFNLALAEIGLKHDAQAAGHFKQVLTLKPGLYEAQLNLGILQLQSHDPGQALLLLREAGKQKPKAAQPHRYLGDALLATGDAAGAAEAYRAALAIDPKLAEAELGLGRTLLKEKQVAEAATHYQQAAMLAPKLQTQQLELADAWLQSGERERAIEVLKEFPNDAGARVELGRLYLDANKPAEAVAAFRAAFTLSPTSANRLALATALIRNQQQEEARPILESALAENPQDYDLHMVVGRIQRDKHEYSRAADQFLAAANLKPDSVEAWNEAATVLVLAEQYPQALNALDRVHNLNADSAGDFYFRAIVLDKLRQVKPALASYRRFLELSQGKNPDQEFIARQRSRILEKEANR